DSEVHQFELAGDATTVLYLAAENLPGRDELFAYDLGTGARRRLNLPLIVPCGGEVVWLSVSPDGNWVLFEVSNVTYSPQSPFWSNPPYGPSQYYAAPADGSAPARLLPHPPLGGASGN